MLISPKLRYWAGFAASTIPVAILVLSAIAKLAQPPGAEEVFGRFGYHSSQMAGIAALELACTALYLFPRTMVLGALLLTGYFGGAIATHVRIEDSFIGPLVLAILMWGGAWIREPRLRLLLPVRS